MAGYIITRHQGWSFCQVGGGVGRLHASINDISGGQTIIRLRGARARDLLNKGCPLDLHPRVFGVGQCAQSHIAKSNALIIQVDDTPTYDVIVPAKLR